MDDLIRSLITRYIFMGDFVDCGYNAVKTFQLHLLCFALPCLKLQYPDCITILRGNHKTSGVSTPCTDSQRKNMRNYGNVDPCKYYTEVVDHLSIDALIEGKIFFCIYGNLSPEIKTLDQVRLIDRLMEVPHEGGRESPFSDMMWSDRKDTRQTLKRSLPVA